ncbi:MAG TPA: cupin domain-containing protein [Gammaproteobacteria bacterium]|nr:cupin domain-containing protein [Gammaproteobacteria bacterium]
MTSETGGPAPTVTLADVIFAGGNASPVPEQDWLQHVQAVAADDLGALEALYERAAAPVLTLIARMLGDRPAAEELTVDVFQEVWRRAPRYNPRTGPVIAWIMNMARSRASDRLWLERGAKRAHPEPERAPAAGGEPGESSLALSQRALRAALSVLTADERCTLESALFQELPHGGVPLGMARARLRSALGKLTLMLERTAGRANPSARCDRTEALYEYVLRAMPSDESAAVASHLAGCAHCRGELEELRRVVDALEAWGTDLLRPPPALRRQLARRIPARDGVECAPPFTQPEPSWSQAAPGIQVKILSADCAANRVSLLVRLAPGFAYPSHRHAGVEELYLLDGELWIDGRCLAPGDYHRADPGTSHQVVWSGTGCSCVLITSANDVLH